MGSSKTQTKECLALNIKALRKRYGFSQEKLAEIADLSAQSISDIEGCRTWVSDKTLEKLAIALDVDIFRLFMPINENNDHTLETFMYTRLMDLRTALKKDIDNRLDRFYIQEISMGTKM